MRPLAIGMIRPFRSFASTVTGIDPGVAIILLAYIVWFGFLIVRGHGIPYAMDNNESFSALNPSFAVDCCLRGNQQLVFQSLVIAFLVIQPDNEIPILP